MSFILIKGSSDYGCRCIGRNSADRRMAKYIFHFFRSGDRYCTGCHTRSDRNHGNRPGDPITFYMDPVASISMLIGAYKGGLYGGSISAIMIGAPGTDSASATVLDGHALAKQGKSAKALKIAAYASVIGDFLGMAALVTMRPLLPGLP